MASMKRCAFNLCWPRNPYERAWRQALNTEVQKSGQGCWNNIQQPCPLMMALKAKRCVPWFKNAEKKIALIALLPPPGQALKRWQSPHGV